MGSKINLQQLAKTLAQKKGLSQKEAEAFLREFFDAIIQNVTTDKLVKIKGLGTFKLIEVLDRESVNVNTGERIVIPGHSKLSFIPETALKDIINKPFADFQTVIINEGTSIEDMERLPEETPSPTLSPEPEQERSEKPEVKEAPVQEVIEEPVEAPKQEPKQEPKPEPVSKPQPDVEPKREEPKRPRPLSKMFAWAAGILLLCIVCFCVGRSLTEKNSTTAPTQEEMQVTKQEQEKSEEGSPTPQEEVQYAQVPGGKFKIVGTRKTYVMKPGDFITRIAIQEYGDKDVAQYIIVHNNFPDPDNVPVDMEIKLPEIKPVE